MVYMCACGCDRMEHYDDKKCSGENCSCEEFKGDYYNPDIGFYFQKDDPDNIYLFTKTHVWILGPGHFELKAREEFKKNNFTPVSNPYYWCYEDE